MSIQSILFDKMYFTKSKAKRWLRDNDFYPLKIHETENFYRFRMLRPKRDAKYRIKKINKGIEFILMF